MSQRAKLLAGVLLVWAGSLFSAAWAAYPERPVRLIVAYPAGASTNDILGRVIAERLSAVLGQTVVVENRPGAGGTIGTTLAAQAEPDGYTLLLGANGPMSISPHVLKKLGYDPVKGFEPITLFAVVPYVIVVNPDLPVKTLKELIAYAKSRPGQVKFGSAGIASTPHLCGELLKTLTGAPLLHVPYKGGAPATAAVIAGETQMYCAGGVGQAPGIRSGRTRGLAVTWETRLEGLPELPSAPEAGVPGLDVASWNGILAPKGTPHEIVDMLNRDIQEIVRSSSMHDFLVKQGVQVMTLGPRDFERFIVSELDKWGKVIRDAGVKVQ
jgi:tripartite-type tricarboxylate transporter receptor subunit TctC